MSGRAAAKKARRARKMRMARTARLLSPHGRSKRWLDDLAVDILPMSDLKNRDLAAGVVDEINDSVVTLTDSIPVVVSGEFLGFG